MEELLEFICDYCAHGKHGSEVLAALNKSNPNMLDNANEDIDMFLWLKKKLSI